MTRSAPPAPDSRDEQAQASVVERARAAACCVALVAAVFLQDPGRISRDTKLDLTADPGRFLGRALHLWDPMGSSGQLGDQAYGYLFPMGPFFLIGHDLGIAPWVVQRLWQSLVLVVGFLGVRALTRALGIGTPTSRLIAAGAFALCPRAISLLGASSVELLPTMVAPWVLVPLVQATEHGRWTDRRAAALSAVAVLCCGGVNASAVLAVLPLPALWLVTRPAGRRPWRLSLWWLLAVGIATAWWTVPLVTLGGYSPPFLSTIESASVTTGVTSLGSVLLGDDHWNQWLAVGGGPDWRAGWTLITATPVIAAQAVLVLGGLLGLVSRRTPHRRVWLGAVLAGAVVVTFGHVGPATSPIAGSEQTLLDNSLAALRNIHKFDVLLRLPLALGVAAVATWRLPSGVFRRLNAPARRWGVAALTVATLAVTVSPVWAGQLEPTGSYTALPAWWQQTATWLRQHQSGPADGRALVIPAASFGKFIWGQPLDDPLQALSTTPFTVRDALPLGGAGSTRVLDSIEQILESGRGSAGLAQTLTRAGIRWLVVRNDLDRVATGAVLPSILHASLAASPGITRLTGFGPQVGGKFGSDGVVADDGLDRAYSAVEIFGVSDAPQLVTALPADTTVRMQGGPESIAEVAEAGLLGGQTATVLDAVDGSTAFDSGTGGDFLTDGYRKQEVTFGRSQDNRSATMTAQQPYAYKRANHDYVVGTPQGHQTVALATGTTTVSASSSASDASAFWLHDPGDGPTAALDGDASTAWVSGSGTAVGQWWQATWTASHAITGLEVRVPTDQPLGPAPATLRVTTDTGTLVAKLPVSASGGFEPVPVPAGPTHTLRLTIDSVVGGGNGTATGLDLQVAADPPAPAATRTLVLAPDTDASAPTVVLQGGVHDRAGCLLVAAQNYCTTNLVRHDEDDAGIDRTFAVPTAAGYTVGVQARIRPGSDLDALLQAGQPVTVTASSTDVPDAADRPASAVDGDAGTGWMAAAQDPNPALTLDWHGVAQTVASLTLTESAKLPASRPTSVLIRTAEGELRTATFVNGVATLTSPVTTASMTLTFPSTQTRYSLSDAGFPEKLPVGISELAVTDTAGVDVAHQALPAATAPFTLACGQGPAIQLDGATTQTSVTTTYGAALTSGTVTLTPCPAAGSTTAPNAANLAVGQHHLVIASTTTAQPTLVTLVPDGTPAAVAGQSFESRNVTVLQWDPDHRRVQVASGQAAWLVVRENANKGWVATLGKATLASASIDGWEQGFLVPAGNGGVVTLDYHPDSTYRLGLAGGGVLAFGVLVFAVLPDRRRRLREARLHPPAVKASATGRRRGVWLAPALGCLALPLVGGAYGVVLLAVVALSLFWARRQAFSADLTRALTAGTLAVATLGIAVRVLARPVDSGGAGLLSATAQLFGLLALAVCVGSLAPDAEDVTGLRSGGPASDRSGPDHGRATSRRAARRAGRTATPRSE